VAVSNATYTSFPGELESVINPTTYALDSAYSPLGGTSEDGVVLRRTAELFDGIPIDQRRTALDEGEPEAWSMEAEVTLMETDLENLQIAWEGGTLVDITGSVVNQKMMPLGAPAAFTERVFVIIQEDVKSSRIRVAALRKTTAMVDGSEINMQKTDATGLAFKIKVRADETVAEHHGPFGKMFEETL